MPYLRKWSSSSCKQPSCGNSADLWNPGSSSALPLWHHLTEVLRSCMFLRRWLCFLCWSPVVSLDSWCFPCSSCFQLCALPTRALCNWGDLQSEPSGGERKMTHPQGNKECMYYLPFLFLPSLILNCHLICYFFPFGKEKNMFYKTFQ